jgi:antitoxin CptB
MTPAERAGVERRRLLWRCRRGMKELDVLLGRYARREQDPRTSAAERAAFERLLDLPDPELAAYLLGQEVPVDPELAQLARRISCGPTSSGEDG